MLIYVKIIKIYILILHYCKNKIKKIDFLYKIKSYEKKKTKNFYLLSYL